MEHNMKLQQQPFDAIKNGKKIIELRLNDEKRQQIQIGDTILFRLYQGAKEELRVTVKALHHADSFAELFGKLSLQDCGFVENTDVEKAVESMRQYYAEEEEQKYGVLGIEISL